MEKCRGYAPLHPRQDRVLHATHPNGCFYWCSREGRGESSPLGEWGVQHPPLVGKAHLRALRLIPATSPHPHLQCSKRRAICQIIILERDEISLKKREESPRKEAKLTPNFAHFGHSISPVLQTNFALINPKFLKTSPKKDEFVDNFLSPSKPNFRKEAAVAELISPSFHPISFSLKKLCIFSIFTIFSSKSANSPKNYRKPASKIPHC